VFRHEYIWLDDLPVAFYQAGSLSHVHTDHLGAPQKMTDGGQNIVWDAVSDPFMAQPLPTNLTMNLRFPGQQYDTETGLHYNGLRDYDPTLGRYIESDPIGLAGGINTYAYVDDNPIAYSDPYGLQIVIPAPLPPPPGQPVIGIPPNAQPPQWLKDWFNDIFGGSKNSTAMESRGNSDPDSAKGLTPVNPGKDCDGNCKSCPPDQQWYAPGNEHGSTTGTHSHGIRWDQDPATCECFPKRVSGPDAEHMK
jgi:RHS repeat-associated protein